MKKIVLLCAGGMSSSYLEKRMLMYITEKGVDFTVISHGIYDANQVIREADFISIAPQVRFEYDKVVKLAPQTPVEIIDMAIYGAMDGERMIDHVLAHFK